MPLPHQKSSYTKANRSIPFKQHILHNTPKTLKLFILIKRDNMKWNRMILGSTVWNVKNRIRWKNGIKCIKFYSTPFVFYSLLSIRYLNIDYIMKRKKKISKHRLNPRPSSVKDWTFDDICQASRYYIRIFYISPPTTIKIIPQSSKQINYTAI